MSDEEWTAVVDQYPVVVNEAFSEEPDHRSGDKKTGMFPGHPRYQLINNKNNYY